MALALSESCNKPPLATSNFQYTPITMPPTARIPTVEFRSLLLAPIRVPLRAFQFQHRPTCATAFREAALPHCLAQRRSLHLYKTAKAKTALGMHKVIHFTEYFVAEPATSQHKVNLVRSDKDPTIIAGDISLEELYNEHIKPGHMLYLTQEIKKKVAENFETLQTENVPNEARNYALARNKVHGGKPVMTPQRGKQLGALKTIMMTRSSPVAYRKLILDRAYQFIEGGSPVEFRIRFRGTSKGQVVLDAEDRELWNWMLDHFPDLRPDFILKAMPAESYYIVRPFSDGHILQFVIGLPTLDQLTVDLTKRLMKVQLSVKSSMQQGRQGMLPKKMRRELVNSGNYNYSLMSAVPRDEAAKKYGTGIASGYWGYDQTDRGKKQVSENRYMVARSKNIPKHSVKDGRHPRPFWV